MADLWDGLESAPTFERGSYFPFMNAHYVVQIHRCLLKDSQESGLGFIVETNVLQSDAAEVPVGSTKGWWVSMTNKNTAFPNVKAFVYSLMGLNPSNPSDAQACAQVDAAIRGIMRLATSEQNVLTGAILNLETIRHKTKAGGDFTIHKWSPFAYEQNGAARPNYAPLLAQAAQAQAAPSYAPHAPAQAPQWGAAPPPMTYAPPAAQPWQAPAPPWQVPANPAPPPWQAPTKAPLPPGAQTSPDGRLYWAPGMAAWAPIP